MHVALKMRYKRICHYVVILGKGICVDDVIISLNRDSDGESLIKKKFSDPKMGSVRLIFEDLAEFNT